MGGGPVSWKSRKQTCVAALSTAEVEYMSLTILAQEAIWLNCLLAELQSQLEPSKPATLYENNQSAICMTKNPQFHGRCKHIAIKYHCIRDEARKGTINVQYCRTDDLIADIFKTKILNLRRSRD